jgi:hypothetical protein
MQEASILILVLAVLSLSLVARSIMDRIQGRLATLSRLEGKIDLLLNQAKLKYDPFADVPREVADAIQQGRKIAAIKVYREMRGVGLKEAKDFVEALQRRAGL